MWPLTLSLEFMQTWVHIDLRLRSPLHRSAQKYVCFDKNACLCQQNWPKGMFWQVSCDWLTQAICLERREDRTGVCRPDLQEAIELNAVKVTSLHCGKDPSLCAAQQRGEFGLVTMLWTWTWAPLCSVRTAAGDETGGALISRPSAVPLLYFYLSSPVVQNVFANYKFKNMLLLTFLPIWATRSYIWVLVFFWPLVTMYTM